MQEGSRADITIIDTSKEFTIDSSHFLSKGHSTPFDGLRVRGRVMMTIRDGRIVWEDKQ